MEVRRGLMAVQYGLDDEEILAPVELGSSGEELMLTKKRLMDMMRDRGSRESVSIHSFGNSLQSSIQNSKVIEKRGSQGTEQQEMSHYELKLLPVECSVNLSNSKESSTVKEEQGSVNMS